MLKKQLIYVLCGSLSLMFGCGKGEEAVTSPSYKDVNWFVIPDKPGEFNQLAYGIYNESGIPIFVNDILGEEYYAKDKDGNPILRTETFNITYVLFGLTGDQDEFASIMEVRECNDEAAQVKAAKAIRDKVIPRIPPLGGMCPKCYFLVDSIVDNTKPGYVLAKTVHSAVKGVVVGDMDKILKMTGDELDVWCGKVIGVKQVNWIRNNCDLAEFYDITREGAPGALTWYDLNYTVDNSEYAQLDDILQLAGMFGLRLDTPERRITLNEEGDILNYVARVYVYRGREQEFYDKYGQLDQAFHNIHGVNNKVVYKYELMKEYVAAFELAYNVKKINW